MITTPDVDTDRQSIIDDETAAQLGTYAKLPIVAVRGEGIMLYDASGKAYHDFYCGHAVTLTGHCHPNVVRAIQEQAEWLIFYSNIVYSDVRADYAKMLVGVAPEGYGQVFFCNSGAEANETALKLSRKFTGRPTIVATDGGFHGRTMGALAMTSNPKYKKGFEPLLPGVEFAPFGDLEAMERLMSEHEVAAVIIEPIQSIAGVRMAEPEYYRGLRELCDRNGSLLVFDEIQTGLGRTGRMWAGEHWGVVPDIITIAKGIASGVPMGATLISTRIAETVHLDEHGSTFGGSPIACAAARATLSTILDEGMVEHAGRMGDLMKARLSGLPHVAEVLGLGLLLGLRLDVAAKDVQAAALEQGIILGTSGDANVLRLMPPMVVTEGDVEHLATVLGDVLGKLIGMTLAEVSQAQTLESYSGSRFVVKLGGEVMLNSVGLQAMSADIALMVAHGIGVVVVHGGGPQADEMARKLGHRVQKVAGRRVTDDDTLEVAKMVYGGSINIEMLAALKRHGARGVGLSGVDAGLVTVVKRPPTLMRDDKSGTEEWVDFGHVGDVTAVDTGILDLLISSGYVPVVASLAADVEGSVYNINADTVATGIAASLDADGLYLVTNVPGILRDPADRSSLISVCTAAEALSLVESGVVSGGMLPKVQNCLSALRGGVKKVRIIDGSGERSLLLDSMVGEGVGTLVVATK